MTTAPTITARRVRKGSKHVVEITVDGQTRPFGGTRAGRAQAAVVSRWKSHAETGWMAELRADVGQARSLAASYTNPNRTIRGMIADQAVWAECVLIEEVEA